MSFYGLKKKLQKIEDAAEVLIDKQINIISCGECEKLQKEIKEKNDIIELLKIRIIHSEHDSNYPRTENGSMSSEEIKEFKKHLDKLEEKINTEIKKSNTDVKKKIPNYLKPIGTLKKK